MKSVARNCKNYNALYAAYSYYDNHCTTIVKNPPSTSIRQLKTNSHSLNRAKRFNFQTLLIYLSFANNFNVLSAHSSAKFRKCFLLSVITRARKIVTKFHNYSYEIVMSPVIVNSYKNGHNSYQIVK